MSDQWTDPRKAPKASGPTRKTGGLIGRGLRKGTRRGPGAGDDQEGADGASSPQPQRRNTGLYVAIGGGAALLLAVIIFAAAGRGSSIPHRRSPNRATPPSSQIMLPDLGGAAKDRGYVPPEGVSSGDCGSIRGICKTCQRETDIADCADRDVCRSKNFLFFHKDKLVFMCFNCGKESPPVRCDQCSGPLYRPKTKAR